MCDSVTRAMKNFDTLGVAKVPKLHMTMHMAQRIVVDNNSTATTSTDNNIGHQQSYHNTQHI